MYSDKYSPSKISELIGNKSQIMNIKSLIEQGKSIIITGPTGCGKSSSIMAIANEMNYEVLVSDSDFSRNKKNLESEFKGAVSEKSLFHKGKIILIENPESIESVLTLTKIIKQSKHPVVIILSDAYNKKFRTLKQLFNVIKFFPIQSFEIKKLLTSVCEKERINYDEKSIGYIALKSGGDIRAALNDLQTVSNKLDFKHVQSLGSRFSTLDIFTTLRLLFKSTSIDSVRSIMEKDSTDPNMLFLWIFENISNEYKLIDEIQKSYDNISRADIFKGRIIRRNSWTLLKYYVNLMSIGISLSKHKPYAGSIMYKPPLYIKSRS